MILRPHFLVLTGDGINCERESARAVELAQGKATIRHVNEWRPTATFFKDYQGVVFPGGFSFGDELGSGQVLALKMRHELGDFFQQALTQKTLFLGICNGMQVLTKLGLLLDLGQEREISMDRNVLPSGNRHFWNQWVKLKIHATHCLWAQGLDKKLGEMELPMRHGEGKVTARNLSPEQLAPYTVFSYENDVNGSTQKIAGLTDKTGQVLGLMPHPEAYVSQLTHPVHGLGPNRLAPGAGLAIFETAINYLKQS